MTLKRRSLWLMMLRKLPNHSIAPTYQICCWLSQNWLAQFAASLLYGLFLLSFLNLIDYVLSMSYQWIPIEIKGIASDDWGLCLNYGFNWTTSPSYREAALGLEGGEYKLMISMTSASGWPIVLGLKWRDGEVAADKSQIWSLTQFYFLGFSKSRIGAK